MLKQTVGVKLNDVKIKIIQRSDARSDARFLEGCKIGYYDPLSSSWERFLEGCKIGYYDPLSFIFENVFERFLEGCKTGIL